MEHGGTLKDKILTLIDERIGHTLGGKKGTYVRSPADLADFNKNRPLAKADMLITFEGKDYALFIDPSGKINATYIDNNGWATGSMEIRTNGTGPPPAVRSTEWTAKQLNELSVSMNGLRTVVTEKLGYAPGVDPADAVNNVWQNRVEGRAAGDQVIQDVHQAVVAPELAKAAADALRELSDDTAAIGAWYDKMRLEGRLGELSGLIDFNDLDGSASLILEKREEHIASISYELKKIANEIGQGGPQALDAVRDRLAGRVPGEANPFAALFAQSGLPANVHVHSEGASNVFAELLGGDYKPAGAVDTHLPRMRGAGAIAGPVIAATVALATGGGISDASAAAGAAMIGDAGMALIEGKGAAEVARGAVTDAAGYAGNAAGMAAGLFTANAASMGVLGTTALTLGGAVVGGVGGVAVVYAAGKAYDAYDNHQAREGLRERMMKLSNDDGYGLKNQALVELYEVAKAPGKFEKRWDEIKAEGGDRYKAVMEYAASTDPSVVHDYQERLSKITLANGGNEQSPEVQSLLQLRSNPEKFAEQWKQLMHDGADMGPILEQLNSMISSGEAERSEELGNYARGVYASPGMSLPI